MGKKTKPRASMLTLVLGSMVCQGRVCLDARKPAARRRSHIKAAVVCLARVGIFFACKISGFRVCTESRVDRPAES
ncbi:hypothetical protein PF002_g23111 [Phytophthora fragariae]|uniref:Uncharacterized protein n=1 Tax=Phytophthora fragariae TaxID=53985 RepID=A0A6A3X6L4_9STRA|nr:hypothetical protein PF002_g23111 [Phytophthora fragariae]